MLVRTQCALDSGVLAWIPAAQMFQLQAKALFHSFNLSMSLVRAALPSVSFPEVSQCVAAFSCYNGAVFAAPVVLPSLERGEGGESCASMRFIAATAIWL